MKRFLLLLMLQGFTLAPSGTTTGTTITLVPGRALTREEERQFDACEPFYGKAKFYSEKGIGHIDRVREAGLPISVTITTSETPDVPSMGAYATMYLACKEREK